MSPIDNNAENEKTIEQGREIAEGLDNIVKAILDIPAVKKRLDELLSQEDPVEKVLTYLANIVGNSIPVSVSGGRGEGTIKDLIQMNPNPNEWIIDNLRASKTKQYFNVIQADDAANEVKEKISKRKQEMSFRMANAAKHSDCKLATLVMAGLLAEYAEKLGVTVSILADKEYHPSLVIGAKEETYLIDFIGSLDTASAPRFFKKGPDADDLFTYQSSGDDQRQDGWRAIRGHSAATTLRHDMWGLNVEWLFNARNVKMPAYMKSRGADPFLLFDREHRNETLGILNQLVRPQSLM